MNLLLAGCLFVVWLGETSPASALKLKLNRKVVPKSNNPASNFGKGEVLVSSQLYNTLYIVAASFGTKPQVLMIHVDTGSEYLWVPQKGCVCTGSCDTKFCEKGPTYDDKASSTAKPTGVKFEVEYGAGSTSGTFINDTFALGESTDPNAIKLPDPVMFGVANNITHDDMGILGLCYMGEGANGTSLMEEMITKKVIEKPMFSIFYKSCPVPECQDSGFIVFGKEDQENCGPVIEWMDPIAKPKETRHWEFKVEEFSMNGVVYAKDFTGITDTGSSHVVVGKKIMDEIVKNTNAKTNNSFIYYIECDALPKLEVKLKIKGKEYTMTSDKLSQKVKNECYLGFMGDENLEGIIVFGDPWIRSYCQVHNWEKAQVGFAEHKNLSPGQATTPLNPEVGAQRDVCPGHVVSQSIFLALFGFVLFR